MDVLVVEISNGGQVLVRDILKGYRGENFSNQFDTHVDWRIQHNARDRFASEKSTRDCVFLRVDPTPDLECRCFDCIW